MSLALSLSPSGCEGAEQQKRTAEDLCHLAADKWDAGEGRGPQKEADTLTLKSAPVPSSCHSQEGARRQSIMRQMGEKRAPQGITRADPGIQEFK